VGEGAFLDLLGAELQFADGEDGGAGVETFDLEAVGVSVTTSRSLR
jgi:hypothetical protein